MKYGAAQDASAQQAARVELCVLRRRDPAGLQAEVRRLIAEARTEETRAFWRLVLELAQHEHVG